MIHDKNSMEMLSRLLLEPEFPAEAASLEPEKLDGLIALAGLNHVVIRGLERLLARNGTSSRAASALAAEQARIENAVQHLNAACVAFEEAGYDVTVIKSLDHWPDLGSDLDLYTTAMPEEVIALMKLRFGAQLAPRSWGDRLAGKWNFLLEGLPEPIEVHVRRLGQTGEQAVIAASLPRRARRVQVGSRIFSVPSASDRLMISTLQRMYRHFFFRLCDVVDTAALADSGRIDYGDLEQVARTAGIWEGVATYLAIVSDYAERYRGTGLRLPYSVRNAARFGGERLFFRDDFLRVPVLPQSASLYGLQLSGLLRRRELRSSARLALLPWLATAAMAGQKLTGSDKGIW